MVATSALIFIEFCENQSISMVRYLYEAESRKASKQTVTKIQKTTVLEGESSCLK